MSHAPTGDAQILDRGYRHFRGERTGVPGAVRALALHSFQRALGLRRNLWAKALPLPAVLIAYLPAIVFVGVVALFPVEDVPTDFLPSYGDYYGYVIAAIMLFVAFVAPEVLCTDRRTGMLGVYLSSPLNRDTYLLGKAIAIAIALSLVCLGPPLLLLLANVLQSQGPDGFTDIVLAFARVLAAGVVLTLFYTGITMGVASLTDRKSIATAGIILLLLVSVMIAGIFSEASNSDLPLVGSVLTLSLDIGPRVHNDLVIDSLDVSDAAVYGAWLAWTVAGFAVARWRIHSLPVTR